jgi:APA family basic amino acid/polyamine antiporter
MVPVLFAYGGWQTSSFVSGEMKNPRRDLPRGLLIGVIGVIVLYLSVTYVCLRSLGVDGLAATSTPASEVMRRALGDRGARLIALGIAISDRRLPQPERADRAARVLRDGARRRVLQGGRTLNPKSRVPVVAIVLQGVWAAVIALTGKYDQILNYVEAIDVLFFGLTGASLIIFRMRARKAGDRRGARSRTPAIHSPPAFSCWRAG